MSAQVDNIAYNRESKKFINEKSKMQMNICYKWYKVNNEMRHVNKANKLDKICSVES